MLKLKLFAIFSGLISFALYFSTMNRTVNHSAGAISVLSAQYLIPWPAPSFPVTMLLGKIFCFIPFETIVFRANLLAALVGSLCVALFSLLDERLLSRLNDNRLYIHLSVITSSMMFAVSTPMWSVSVAYNSWVVSVLISLILFLVFVSFAGKVSRLKSISGIPQNLSLAIFLLFGISVGESHGSFLFLPGFLCVFILALIPLLAIKWKESKVKFLKNSLKIICFCILLYSSIVIYFEFIINLSRNMYNLNNVKAGIVLPAIIILISFIVLMVIRAKKGGLGTSAWSFDVYSLIFMSYMMFILGYSIIISSVLRFGVDGPLSYHFIGNLTLENAWLYIGKSFNVIYMKGYGNMSIYPTSPTLFYLVLDSVINKYILQSFSYPFLAVSLLGYLVLKVKSFWLSISLDLFVCVYVCLTIVYNTPDFKSHHFSESSPQLIIISISIAIFFGFGMLTILKYFESSLIWLSSKLKQRFT